MGSKYSSQAVSGFDSSPPVDDGSATEANKVKWSTIKNKLASPLKTHAEAINTALVTALDQSCRTVSANDAAAASDHDRTIQVTTSSVTITLADAATMAAGYLVSVANQSGGDITIALASATDTIDTVTNATQTISAKEVRTYIVNTAATGYITHADRVVAASDTIAGKIELATQAEQETGTDVTRAVTPGRQQYHPSAAKAWVTFVGSSANPITPDAGYNIDGTITKHATGDYTITFSTDFSSANYVVVGTVSAAGSGNALTGVGIVSQAVGSCRINTHQSTALVDLPVVTLAFFGDQ
jgi:adenosyl cobinamide kinase/adenosyl cobinamide phosphate guanylyltransferase